MTELLFGVTLAFVGYVLYQVFKTVWDDDAAEPPSGSLPAAAPAKAPQPEKAAPSEAKLAARTAPSAPAPAPAPAAAKPEPEPAPVQAKPVPTPPTPAAKEEPAAPPPAAKDGEPTMLRNPATGEVSPVPTNYRFAKKWIKEALVAEGLLDHIYKPNELDDVASNKVREALEKLRVLDKYRA